MSDTGLMIVGALVIGSMVPFQLVFNAQLGGVTKSAYTAGLIVFLVGVVAMAIAVIALREPLPSIPTLLKSPPTIWLGGLIATLYILAIVIITPKLGVGTTAVLVITGQILMALLLDHLGLFGNPQVSFNLARLLGSVLVLAGVIVIRIN